MSERCPQCGTEIGGELEQDLEHIVGGHDCLCRQVAQFKAVADDMYRLAPSLKKEGIGNWYGYFVHWDEVLTSLAQAWPEEQVGYGECPLELVVRLINERDELKAENEPLQARLATPIVCLCGSTRFIDQFDDAARELTLRGIIVLSQKPWMRQFGENLQRFKLAREALPKRKIDLAHSIFVLNIDSYVGESTQSEIDYAEAAGKPICYWTACQIAGDAESWDEIAAGCREAAKAAEENET